MASWLVGLIGEVMGVSMAVMAPVGGASLSGSNSSSTIRVFRVSLMGWGGGGERGRAVARVLLLAAHRASVAPGGGETEV